MKSSRHLALKISFVVIIFLIILGYGLFQARNLIIGPEIVVLTPKEGGDLTDQLVVVAGSATNITRISLDDRQIFVDKHGNFSEKLLVPPGYTIIKLAAQDKFGRTTQKLIELNYTTSREETASSTVVDTREGASATSSQNIIQ